MLDVRNAIADILDHTTLADVAQRVELARALLGINHSKKLGEEMYKLNRFKVVLFGLTILAMALAACSGGLLHSPRAIYKALSLSRAPGRSTDDDALG